MADNYYEQPLSDFLKQIELEHELSKQKRNQLREMSIQIESLEKNVAVSKRKQNAEVQILNNEISILKVRFETVSIWYAEINMYVINQSKNGPTLYKDELERQTEHSSTKLGYCLEHEEELVQKYHSCFHASIEEWNRKIRILETENEHEIQRSACLESQLCATIEVFCC